MSDREARKLLGEVRWLQVQAYACTALLGLAAGSRFVFGAASALAAIRVLTAAIAEGKGE